MYLEHIFADGFQRDLGAGQPRKGRLSIIAGRPAGTAPAARALPELNPLQQGPTALPGEHTWAPTGHRTTCHDTTP